MSSSKVPERCEGEPRGITAQSSGCRCGQKETIEDRTKGRDHIKSVVEVQRKRELEEHNSKKEGSIQRAVQE